MQFYNMLILAVVVCSGLHSAVAESEAEAALGSNPIRKVVTLLEGMLEKVESEGKEEKHLYEVFMCTCKKGIADLEKTIAANKGKGPNLELAIKQASASQTKLEDDLVKHRASVAAAATALEEATGVRAQEKKAFDADAAEKGSYISSINKALPSLEKGMKGGASMLQTESALALSMHNAAAAAKFLTEDDRDAVLSFLSSGHAADQEYAPAGGEIVGILKNMVEEYQKDLAGTTATETAAVKVYEELKEAKTQQMKSVRYTIQEKVARSGELAVDLVQKKGDLKETNAMMAADNSMLDNLNASCDAKVVEWDRRTKMRNDEIAAIHDTVKLLSNDDALDTFKGSMTAGSGGGGAFLQLSNGAASEAQKRLRQARDAAALFKDMPGVRPELRFLELALSGKKIDFSKVTKMIDDMIANDAKAQTNDSNKKKHCKNQFHKTEAKKQKLARKISDQEANKADRTAKMETIVAEIEDTTKEIKALDVLVKEAEAERKKQNAEYSSEYAGKSSATEILQFAKKRLNEFYNPTGEGLSLASVANQKLSEMTLEMNPVPTKNLFKALDSRPAGVTFLQLEANNKRIGDSNKVVKMFNVMLNDLKVEMVEMKREEGSSQSAYEKFVDESAKKRATYVKSLTVKENAKADGEETAVRKNKELEATNDAAKANSDAAKDLHEECDWLIKNMEFRRSARDAEVDGLKKGKAVLSGADYSLVQSHASFLGRR